MNNLAQEVLNDSTITASHDFELISTLDLFFPDINTFDDKKYEHDYPQSHRIFLPHTSRATERFHLHLMAFVTSAHEIG